MTQLDLEGWQRHHSWLLWLSRRSSQPLIITVQLCYFARLQNIIWLWTLQCLNTILCPFLVDWCTVMISVFGGWTCPFVVYWHAVVIVRLWCIDVLSLCPFVADWRAIIMFVCGGLTCSHYVRLWCIDMLSLCPFVVDWRAVVMFVCGCLTCSHYVHLWCIDMLS